jgi:hypothetical protein
MLAAHLDLPVPACQENSRTSDSMSGEEDNVRFDVMRRRYNVFDVSRRR